MEQHGLCKGMLHFTTLVNVSETDVCSARAHLTTQFFGCH